MRITLALILGAMVLVSPIRAAENDRVLVARGEHKITLADMDARMSRFPTHERAQFARDPANLARLMDRMLVDSVLVAEARELGLDKRPEVQRDIEIAVREVLATHRLNEFFRPEAEPDFGQIARERYLADPSAFDIPGTRIVEHVLIATGERSDEDALERAQDVLARAKEPGASFAALVQEFSDDPSKEGNQGRFTLTGPEGFAAEFSEAAYALEAEGDISNPVKTQFGYHIIRLVEAAPGRSRSYEEVEQELVAKARRDYQDNHRVDYLADVRSRYEETGNEELLRTLPARYGGRPEETSAPQSR
jgi:hypothetical protein